MKKYIAEINKAIIKASNDYGTNMLLFCNRPDSTNPLSLQALKKKPASSGLCLIICYCNLGCKLPDCHESHAIGNHNLNFITWL